MSKALVRIIIVEDDKDIRELVWSNLHRTEDLRMVASFPNGDDFLAALNGLDADVVIMDINMPGTSGIDCIRAAKPQKPGMQFLVHTVCENPAYIFQALCAGATGYVVKDADPDELIEAVRNIAQGGSPMSPAIARLVVNSFQGQVQERVNNELLTDRERTIIDRMAKGLLYKEIGAELHITSETVRKHARNIYEKLQVNTRIEAIRKVYPSGAPTP
jgi:DNA-binding NarL/FixJ family response regulator